MNLSDYISLTLSEIAEGVQKANDDLGIRGGGRVLSEISQDVIGGVSYLIERASGGYVKKPIINVAFRVGVELDESKERKNKVGGSLRVVSIDHETTKKGDKRCIHEVSFEIPFVLSE